jgi:hypothetical protein
MFIECEHLSSRGASERSHSFQSGSRRIAFLCGKLRYTSFLAFA